MRNAELLKAIRRGEWEVERVREWFKEKEAAMEQLYVTSTAIPHSPDEDAIRNVLVECLRHHYGSIDDAYHDLGKNDAILIKIRDLVSQVVL